MRKATAMGLGFTGAFLLLGSTIATSVYSYSDLRRARIGLEEARTTLEALQEELEKPCLRLKLPLSANPISVSLKKGVIIDGLPSTELKCEIREYFREGLRARYDKLRLTIPQYEIDHTYPISQGATEYTVRHVGKILEPTPHIDPTVTGIRPDGTEELIYQSGQLTPKVGI